MKKLEISGNGMGYVGYLSCGGGEGSDTKGDGSGRGDSDVRGSGYGCDLYCYHANPYRRGDCYGYGDGHWSGNGKGDNNTQPSER